MMIEEVGFMSKIIGGRVSQPIDLNQIYIENIGSSFVESISTKEIFLIVIYRVKEKDTKISLPRKE